MTPLPANFLAKTKTVCNGCIEWQGYVTPSGYGRTTKDRKPCWAHRRAYELSVGPIPEGKQIDHLCRNRRCVNPAHLEVVTPMVNTMRGESFAAKNAEKTHCKNGHEFKEGSYWPAKPRGRRCKECVRLTNLSPSIKAWRSEYYKKRRARIIASLTQEPARDV